MPKPRCRTGCITCRIRRVKCDEKHPDCLRCTSTGRKCDGYRTPATVQSKDVKNLRVSIVAKRGPVLYFSPSSIHSPAEQRSLQFFRERTAKALTAYFDSAFWSSTLLRVAHTHPVVLHATVALSSLHEGIEVGGDIRPGNERNYVQRRFAIQQYDKAIEIMLPRMAGPESWSSEESLIACLLFVMIEIAQSNYNIAAEQMKIGFRNIKLLAARMAPKPSLGLESDVRKLFGRFFVQCMFLGEPMQVHPPTLPNIHVDIYRLHDILPPVPPRVSNIPFCDLSEACDALDALYLGVYPVLFALGRQHATLESQSAMISLLNLQLEMWKTQFDALLAVKKNHHASKQIRAATLLTVHATALSVMLSSTPSHSNTLSTPSSSIPAFQTILTLATNLLSGPESMPEFAFDHGLIAPLFYTVVKCPLRSLRLHAVELLRHPHIPRREAMWCGKMTAVMAAGIFQVSEEMRRQAAIGDSGRGRIIENTEIRRQIEDVQGMGVDIPTGGVGVYFDKDVGDDREIKLRVGSKYAGPYIKEVVVSW